MRPCRPSCVSTPRQAPARRGCGGGAGTWSSFGICKRELNAVAIAEAIHASSSLTYLSLRNNNIGDLGAWALAAGVAASSSLTYLSLRNNNIGDWGAKALAAGVASSSSLADFDLQWNNIGDAGAKAIAEAGFSGAVQQRSQQPKANRP